eukprot:CAMPEP_0174260588 /NCGR_PEP_ID=MMETSP0439-20130205/9998_1 /TAXON_ID=0 /ORGANISM="Stereomyxa ramosa, Strain Chinc5" /LENGTH=401 /DNA_ID=CAMNT_0015344863 /DNA_START=606 /DNA_END=1811 /DNA_ORIENTATION=+
MFDNSSSLSFSIQPVLSDKPFTFNARSTRPKKKVAVKRRSRSLDPKRSTSVFPRERPQPASAPSFNFRCNVDYLLNPVDSGQNSVKSDRKDTSRDEGYEVKTSFSFLHDSDNEKSTINNKEDKMSESDGGSITTRSYYVCSSSSDNDLEINDEGHLIERKSHSVRSYKRESKRYNSSPPDNGEERSSNTDYYDYDTYEGYSDGPLIRYDDYDYYEDTSGYRSSSRTTTTNNHYDGASSSKSKNKSGIRSKIKYVSKPKRRSGEPTATTTTTTTRRRDSLVFEENEVTDHEPPTNIRDKITDLHVKIRQNKKRKTCDLSEPFAALTMETKRQKTTEMDSDSVEKSSDSDDGKYFMEQKQQRQKKSKKKKRGKKNKLRQLKFHKITFSPTLFTTNFAKNPQNS